MSSLPEPAAQTLACVPVPAPSPAPPPPRDPYAAVRDWAAALRADDVRIPNASVLHAVAVVVACLPRLRGLAASFVDVPRFDPTVLERLEVLIAALQSAQYYCEVPEPDPDRHVATDAELAEAFQLRRAFAASFAAMELSQVPHLPRSDALRLGPDHQRLATDLGACVAYFRFFHPENLSRTPFDSRHLDRADALRVLVAARCEARGSDPARRDPMFDLRNRLWTLLDDAWDEVRRTVAYLRWNDGDPDAFAPTLQHKSRTRARRERRARRARKIEDAA